jgi:hypothetical protein
MPADGRSDLAHPEAAGWVLGNLDPAEAEEFSHHLETCNDCQAAVAELAPVGQALRHLPPSLEPPPDLEARTLATVARAAQAATAPAPAPATIMEIAARAPVPAADAPASPAKATRRLHWNWNVRLLGAAAAIAAVAIAAAVVLPSLVGGAPAQAATFSLQSPSGQAAGGVATDRPDASGSWVVTLSVHNLKDLGPVRFYECWYAGPDRRPGHRQFVSAGTFVVGRDGSGTFSMTSAVDPHMFRTMEITAESPGDGAQHGPVILTGRARL